MIQRILPAYYFSLECLLLYFLLFIFYNRSEIVPNLFAFLAVFAIAQSTLLVGLKLKRISTFLPFIGAVISGGIGFLLGLSLLSSILCTFFLFFRISAFLKDSSLWTAERSQLLIVFYCGGIFILIEGWLLDYSHMNWHFVILLIFTSFFSVGRFLQHIAVKHHDTRLIEIFTTMGIAFLLTGIGALCIPVVKWLFFNIFEGFTVFLSYLVRPIFDLIEGIELQQRPKPPGDESQGQTGEAVNTYEDLPFFENIPAVTWLLLIILIMLVVWFFMSKRKPKIVIEPDESPIEITRKAAFTRIGQKRSFFSNPAPKDYIRKLIFDFQLFAEKQGVGRYHHETIREWFTRLNFPMNEALIIAYENVRYGEMKVPKQELKHLEQDIVVMKKIIKERIKREKDRD